jgi:outer membrane protein assembly factor BamB
MSIGLLLLAGGAGLLAGPKSRPAEWNRFRGPNGAGVAEASGLPVEMGPQKNVVWKAALPPGHSSPILSGGRIFLTALEGEKLWTICLDQATGKILWRTEAPRARTEKIDRRNHAASPSPAVDGDRVFVFFPDFGLLAYDLRGKEKWRLPLGPFNNVYGMGASPVVADDKVVLVVDQSTNSYILAAGKNDGRVRWKVPRPEAKSGHSTPILYAVEKQTQLIVPGSFVLSGYAADTGKRLWWVNGLSFEMKSTPVMNADAVFVNGYGSPDNQPENIRPVMDFKDALAKFDRSGDRKFSAAELEMDARATSNLPYVDLDGDGLLDETDWNYYQAAMASVNGMLAIRPGGTGDMSKTSIRWQYHRAVPQLPSPLLYNGVLYMVNDGGVVTTFRPATGEVIAQGRLQGAVDSYYASPVAADGKVYMVSLNGKVVVLKTDGSLAPVAVSDLDDMVYATPAIADGRIYIRTRSALFAFGTK